MNKMNLKLAVLLSGLALSGAAFAHGTNSFDNAINAANNEVGIGFTQQQSNYSENIVSPYGSDVENGSMPGFDLFGRYSFDAFGINHIYTSIKYTRISGNTNYRDGSNAIVAQHVTNDVDVKLGKTFYLNSDSAVTPYLFGGYNSWYRDVPGSVASPENYSNGFIGLGAKYQFAVSRHLVLAADAGMGEVIGGHISATLDPVYSEVGFDTPSQLNLSMADRPYYQIGVSADYRVDRHLHLLANVGYTDFMYGGTKMASFQGSGETAGYTLGLREPSSQTSNLGIGIGIAYGF